MAELKAVARGLFPPHLWDLGSRIRHGTKPKRKIVHGVEMLFPPRHPLPSTVASFPRFDTLLPEFLHFLMDGRQKKLLVVDVGANIGDTAALASAKIGVDAMRIICLEADEQYLPFLRANTENLDAEIICAIIGSSSREEPAAVQRTSAGSGVIIASTQAAKVLALDDVLHGQTPDLIKIDTDGYDLEVLRGARRCLQNTGPHLFIELSPYHLRMYGKEEPAAVFSFLRDMGYSATIIYDNTGYPICLLDLDSRQLEMIVEYVDIKPRIYADLLISKNNDLLARFYESDRKRFFPGKKSISLG